MGISYELQNQLDSSSVENYPVGDRQYMWYKYADALDSFYDRYLIFRPHTKYGLNITLRKNTQNTFDFVLIHLETTDEIRFNIVDDDIKIRFPLSASEICKVIYREKSRDSSNPPQLVSVDMGDLKVMQSVGEPKLRYQEVKHKYCIKPESDGLIRVVRDDIHYSFPLELGYNLDQLTHYLTCESIELRAILNKISCNSEIELWQAYTASIVDTLDLMVRIISEVGYRPTHQSM